MIRIYLGGLNCYLVPASPGFVIADTGTPEKRSLVEGTLEEAGCHPGDLKLIVVTHGDYDHAGNAAHLRAKYGAPVAMHPGDWERVRRGDWSFGFKSKPDRFALPFRLVSRFVKPGAFTVFEPDIPLEDGQSLAEYGLDATVLHLPGHTQGSVGILMRDGGLVCGDLMDSLGRPGLHFFIDDMDAAKVSMEKVQRSGVATVYPGHGKPFRLDSRRILPRLR